MMAAGLDSSERVSSAIDWLDAHPSISKVPGFEDAGKELGWDEGLKFYYLMGLSRIFLQSAKKNWGKRPQSIVKELVELQHDNGAWQNKSDRMREDDPHIATSFALIALSNLVIANKK